MGGWRATTSSNCDFLSPAFTAIAAAWRISGASGPIMCRPTTCSASPLTPSCTSRRRRAGRRRLGAGHVQADDLLRLAVHHQLVQRALVAVGEHILHRPEIGG